MVVGERVAAPGSAQNFHSLHSRWCCLDDVVSSGR